MSKLSSVHIDDVLEHLIDRGFFVATLPSPPSTAFDIREFLPLEDDRARRYRLVIVGSVCEVFLESDDGSASLYLTARRALEAESEALRRTAPNAV